jgi:hypothetical protein
MSMIADSATRVKQHTSPEMNQRLQQQTRINVAYYAAHPDQIPQRLAELDREWDVERALAMNSSALSLFGLAMTVLRGRRWLVLPVIVQGFFVQHAIEGWCPPLPLLRRLGLRTQFEIEQERYALKALRGDFQQVNDGEDAAARAVKAFDAARHDS